MRWKIPLSDFSYCLRRVSNGFFEGKHIQPFCGSHSVAKRNIFWVHSSKVLRDFFQKNQRILNFQDVNTKKMNILEEIHTIVDLSHIIYYIKVRKVRSRDMVLHREIYQLSMNLDFDLIFLLLGWILEVFSKSVQIFVYK